jgi:SAM-dependent methyltransferase
MIVHMTELWYKSVLDRLPDNAKVLDIGIGTGSALARHAQLVQRKNLRWFGVDYDAQVRYFFILDFHIISLFRLYFTPRSF